MDTAITWQVEVRVLLSGDAQKVPPAEQDLLPL